LTYSILRKRLLASSMISGVALAAASAGGAYAQMTPAAAAASTSTTGAATVGELVVTGSRIPTPNLTSVSPIQVVTDKEIALEGTTNIETLLNNLPQVSPDMGMTSTNGTAGAANVDLRGLGAKRTLVMIDGKRLQPGDPLIPVPDLNMIPAALVDRVDVVTGGASAVYGSDAVSGVVNFIMKKDFQGVRIDAQYGFFQHDNNDQAIDTLLNNGIESNGVPLAGPHGNIVDGGSWNVTGIIGVNAPDDKGNITAYFGYRRIDPILSSERDFAACEIATAPAGGFGTSAIYNTHLCLGSSNSAFGRFLVANGTNTLGLPPAGDFANSPTGTKAFVPFGAQYDFNFAPFQYLQREDQRYTAGFYAHYDINQYITAYSDFMFSDDTTVGQLGPSGLFLGSPTFNINCNNPLMSAQQQSSLCGTAAGTATETSVEIGYRFSDVSGSAAPRDFDFIHDAYKVDVGLKGDLGSGWHYDGYLQEGYTLFNETVSGQYVDSLIQNALLVDPTTGKCISGGSCVPLNVFQVGGITSAMAQSMVGTQVETGYTEEQTAELDVTGDLGHYGIKSPWATDGVGIALGADYRQDRLLLSVDPITQKGLFAGSGGPTNPASGEIDVKELYGELRIPIVQDVPFVKLLEFEGGYRLSSYSTSGTTQTYKLGGEWAPTQDIRFRASYNKAVRAPNVVELFTPQSPGLFSGRDPCAGGPIAPGSADYAGCIASGATPAELASATGIPQCPAGQCGEITGGNPLLKPEVATTYSVGGVFTPRWVPGLSLSIDYFNIKVTNVIESGLGGPSVELSQCVATSSPLYCAFVKRDPVLGSIWANTGAVESINANVGELATSGFDGELNYRFRFSDFHAPDWGSLAFNFVGTYTEHLITTPIAGGGSYDCAGLYGAVCGTPTPYWRSKLRITWTPPSWPMTLSLQWRYLGGVGLDINSANPFLEGGDAGVTDTVPGEAHIPQYSYFDLSGTWRFMNKYTFRAGINNIFDNNPPVIDTGNLGLSVLPFGNGNTYPNVYDSLGREFFVGLTADF
jgi:outer membrane receptor protein involved in Fe transport